MSTETEEKKIDNVFEGWENPEDVNFLEETLGTEAPQSETATIVAEATAEEGVNLDATDAEKKKEAANKALAEKEKLSDDTFEEWNDNEEPSETTEGTEANEDEEEDEETNDISTSIGVLNQMKEKGLLHYELEEDEELTEELAEQLIEDSYDASLDARAEEMMKDLPESVKNLVKYSLKGGNPDALMAQMVQQPTNTIDADMDMTDEANQEAVVRASRIEKGEDKESIDSYIGWLKDSKKLEAVATKEHISVVAKKKDFLKNQAKAQADKSKAARLNAKKFKQEVVTLVNNKDNGVKLSRQEKKELPDYMTTPNVELKNGAHISQMQSDIFEALKDKEKALKLAKILKNDFDFTDFIVDEKTKVVKKVHGTVKSGNKKRDNRSSQPKRKSLAELLD